MHWFPARVNWYHYWLWVRYIAAGQYLYYHVSPLPLGNRSRCLHIYCVFVYLCSACFLSPKLAHVSLFLVWVVDCAVAVLGTDLLKSLFAIRKVWDNKLLFSDICSKSCTVTEYKTLDVLQKIWTTNVNFSFETWILFTCSAEKEWVWLYMHTFHHAA